MPDGGTRSGYKNPPKNSRFAKGRSGNPKGRPRKNLEKDTANIFNRELSLEVNGKATKVPVHEALGISLLRAALKGDRRAARSMFEHSSKIGFDKIEPEPWVPYTRVLIDPKVCDPILLALGAIREVPEDFDKPYHYQGPFRIELWFLEETLKRNQKKDLTSAQIEKIARSTVDPARAMEILGRAGYATFPLEPLKLSPRPPPPPEDFRR